MSSCFGCFPHYQANQLAHMEPGGCLYCADNEEMFCQPTNLESAFDAAAAEELAANAKKEEEVECCICYEIIGEKNNCVTECGHRFCFGCMLKAMTVNTTCPYCRTELLQDFPGEESDEEEGGDDASEISEDDEDFVDENQGYAHIEDIAERLEKEGVTMLDVVSLLFNKYSKKDAKWTAEYIHKLDELTDRVEMEVENEARERHEMEEHDTAKEDAVRAHVLANWNL